MKLHLKIIEADNIPKMDMIGKADPYVSVHLSESKDSDKTKIIYKTYTPKWNKEMHLRVASISENVKFELKDYDKGKKDDLIGTIERKIRDFPPGIVSDEWINVNKAKGLKKVARVHIISHLTLDGMTPFTQMPFQFLKVCVKVISARDIAKMDLVGKTDPYVVLWIQSHPSSRRQTKVIKNNMLPKWNEDFLLELTNQTSDILTLKMWDKDVVNDDEMATLDIPLGQFQLFDIVEKEYDMKPCKGVKKGGKITLKIQVIPINEEKWKVGAALPISPNDQQFQSMMIQQMQGIQQSGMMMMTSGMMQSGMMPQQMMQSGMMPQGMMQSQQMQPGMQPVMKRATVSQIIPEIQPGYPQPAERQIHSVMYPQGLIMQPGMYPQQGMMMQPGTYPQQQMVQPGMYPQQGMMMQPGMYPQQGMMMQQGMYPQQGMMMQPAMYQQQMPPTG
ncbi:hypothetical protein M9Y10_046040 [Tritrichomonas musculus]|uniref:C2 domain-containing protein n=1 Tax=Tritrichomonas musculus TaxID=1915356 RepID=A0ABR2JX16_9EUKA